MRKLVAVGVVLLAGSADADIAPTVSFAAPKVSGSFDAKLYAKAIAQANAPLVACYRDGTSELVGTTTNSTLTFKVQPSGKLSDVTISNQLSEGVRACITAAVAKLAFPTTKAVLDVTYELTFDPHMTGVGGLITTPTVDNTMDVDVLATIGRGPDKRATSSDVATISLGQLTVTGELDKALVRRHIKREVDKLHACYEKQLVVTPKLEGTVTASFTIDKDGAVTSSNATGMNDKTVEACIAGAIKAISFPKPKTSANVTVVYPFTFKPPASTIGAGRTGTLAGPDSATGTGGTAAPGAPTITVGEAQTSGGELDKAIIRRLMKRNSQKLLYCFERERLARPVAPGTVTVDFTIGADGLVSRSTAAGLGDKEVEACFAKVIRAIEFPKPKNGAATTVKYPFVLNVPPNAAKK